MINFKITKITEEGNTSSFTIEPLEKGFGHTLGNCLRRVLLSSLEGTAISSVKIEGVSHQFSTLPGISEDIIQIILNLKKIRIKLFGQKPVKFVLKASGKKDVKAGDIDTQGAGEIVNPDLHIASLNTPSAKLNMEMTVEKGVGYAVADEKKSDEIGVIPVDSIFSPILAVQYTVEATRVGRSTNYDNLMMNITTDGTIAAEDALNYCSKVLADNFRQIYEPVFEEQKEEVPSVSEDMLKMSVEELDLPVRITNALKAVEIDTVGKLVSSPKSQLLKTKNLGVQSITLISQKLAERGLSLSEA